MRYIAELERKVQTLQTEATSLSAQLTLLQVYLLPIFSVLILLLGCFYCHLHSSIVSVSFFWDFLLGEVKG